MTISQLPFPKYTGLKHVREYTLFEPMFIESQRIPAGTTIKLITGRDFGFVILPPNMGFHRRFFKY